MTFLADAIQRSAIFNINYAVYSCAI